MKIRFISACIVMLLLVGLLASCGEIKDPLPETIQPSASDAGPEEETEPTVYSLATRMPSTCFYKGYLYPYNTNYVIPTVSGIRTFMKYDLKTGAESPVCMDPMCEHDLFQLYKTETSCPFGYGAKPFAIKDDTVYFTTEIDEAAKERYNERKAYSYNMKNMRLIYLFSYFDGVFGNDVLNMIGGKIFYTDYDVHDDLSVDRYFCVYDLSNAKSERLFRFNSFENPDTGWIDQIKTETDLSPMFVNGECEAFFHTKTAVFSAKAKKDAEIVKIADLGSYGLELNQGFWRDGKLYFITKRSSESANRIISVDCASGKTEIIADNAVYNFTVSGDLLCYWLFNPIELPGGFTILSHSIVVLDLVNGTSQTVDFGYENGFNYTLDDMFLYNGKVYLLNAGRFVMKDGAVDDSVMTTSTIVFDLDNSTWNVLYESLSSLAD